MGCKMLLRPQIPLTGTACSYWFLVVHLSVAGRQNPILAVWWWFLCEPRQLSSGRFSSLPFSDDEGQHYGISTEGTSSSHCSCPIWQFHHSKPGGSLATAALNNMQENTATRGEGCDVSRHVERHTQISLLFCQFWGFAKKFTQKISRLRHRPKCLWR
jgi:hypothetical protein